MDTQEVMRLLQEVAAEVVTPRFGSLQGGDVDRKGMFAPVTAADREAEERLTAALRAAYPSALVLGEEAVSADPTLLRRFAVADHAFTIDPVDGTRHFVRGSPDHAVMAAELRGGEVVRSWIWQPQHRRAYVAERGAGAWCGERRLRVERPARRWATTATCSGIDYPRLVEGRAGWAAYVRPWPWDHAPGSLLLSEAGGSVRAWSGRPGAGAAYRPQAPRPALLLARGA